MNQLATTSADRATPDRQLPQELRDALASYRDDHSLSLKALGQRIGVDGTQISRVINGTFEGNRETMLGRIEDFLKNEQDRRAIETHLFHSQFVQNAHDFLNLVKNTGQMGLGFSAAGKGKTSAIELYLAANPLAVGITAAQWDAGAPGLIRRLFEQVGSSSWPGNKPRSQFLMSRFKNSGRLIIVDNAQRITNSGLDFLFDFYDETKTPIALFSNPEILAKIVPNDQRYRRIGAKREIKGYLPGTSPADSGRADVANMISLHWPDVMDNQELHTLALQVAAARGHLGRLRNQLLIAKDLHGTGAFATPAESFQAAATQLIQDDSNNSPGLTPFPRPQRPR